MWTEFETQYLIDNIDRNYTEVSKILHKHRTTISAKAKLLGINKYVPRYEYNIDFFKIPSADLSYFLGFLMSDGSISKKQMRINIHPKDIEILQHFQKLICKTKPIKCTNYFNKSKGKYYKLATFCITNQEIINLLLNDYKIPSNKTGNEIIPEISKEYINDFIRGAFDGDGSVSRNGKGLVSLICCKSKIYLEQIQKIYKIGKISKGNGIFRWKMATGESRIFKDIIYNGNFGLSRKKFIFDNYDFNSIVCRKPR